MRLTPRDKVGIISLGCPRNLVDAEGMLGRLLRKGHRIADIDKADIGIVNTCAFIDDAKKESIDAILGLVDLKKRGRLKKIIVAGCLPQRYKEKLVGEFPEVDAFIGAPSLNHTLERFPITPGHYAYLKICEGCINNCSYCVVPRIKGRFNSLKPRDILNKVELLNREGIAELNIIGQDLSGYGSDLCGRPQLSAILKKIIRKSSNIGWIRLLYLYPSRISDDLLVIMKNEEKVCKYLDVPVQHISDRILKLMRRGTASKDILRLLAKIRKTIPQAALRTSLIVGFPSETDKEFRELLDFIKEARFEKLGAFIYSREEGTAAYNFEKQLPPRVKEERFNAVMTAQQEISAELNKKFLGRSIEVLIDEKDAGNIYLGRSRYDAPEVDGLVYVRSERELRPGDFVRVEINDTLEYDLAGEVA